jgi:hypothetical protein
MFEDEAAGFLTHVAVHANSRPAIKGTPKSGRKAMLILSQKFTAISRDDA